MANLISHAGSLPVDFLSVLVVLALGATLRRWISGRRVRLRLHGRASPNRRRPRLAIQPFARVLRRSFGVRRATPLVSAQSLAMLLDDVARRCASGETLTSAFVDSREVVVLAPAFDHVITATQRGATLAEALQYQAGRSGDNAALSLTMHVLGLCARVGGNVSEPLDRAAATLRERNAAAQERIAQSAQARLSARVLTFVPLGFASWTLLTSGEVRRFMVTPTGLVCACLGLSLNLAGSRLMNRIIEGAR